MSFPPSINNTIDHLDWTQPSITVSRKRGERVTRKPRVVTFRLDEATWDRMRELVPYTKYRNTSSFIRAAHPYLPQSQTLRIIFATACHETFSSSLLVLVMPKVAT